jgi:hypothetical protein
MASYRLKYRLHSAQWQDSAQWNFHREINTKDLDKSEKPQEDEPPAGGGDSTTLQFHMAESTEINRSDGRVIMCAVA